MKRYGVYFVLIAVLLGVLVASPSLAVFPIPDTQVTLTMQQGWYDGIVAWFICTDTNDVDFAKTPPFPTLTPNLRVKKYSLMYIVTNPKNSQGPVFSTSPRDSDYSPICSVRFVTWLPGKTKVTLTSAAQILALQTSGDLQLVDPDVRLDCPILALGPLGGPWNTNPLPPYYRIPQGMAHDPRSKTIVLPAWHVFCQDPVTRRIAVRTVIIPDVSTESMAENLGANLAETLAAVLSQPFWRLSNPNPPSQLPVGNCPNGIGLRNTNFDYAQVRQFLVLRRDIPPWTVVNNPPLIRTLINSGGLTIVSSFRFINAPVVD